MELSYRIVILIIATLLTGLSAGLCFTWANAVTPGIGRLDALGYLQSFQEMNRAIINPTFLLVFFGPVLMHGWNLFVYRNAPDNQLWLLITAAVMYFLGVVLVTIFGNVPLNEMLDKTDLAQASLSDLQAFRERFEQKWNRLHLIRTLTATSSFLLLLLSLVLSAKSIPN